MHTQEGTVPARKAVPPQCHALRGISKISNKTLFMLQILRNGTAVSYGEATDPLCPYSENRTENKMEFDMEIIVNASRSDIGSIRTECSGPLQSNLFHRG